MFTGQPMIATVDLLSKAIRTLGSSAIGEIYKTAFQTMLAMFDVRSKDSIATEVRLMHLYAHE